MIIRPVEFNGMIQNTAEVSQNKVADDQQPLVQQQNISQFSEQAAEVKLHQVNGKENAAENNAKVDENGSVGNGTYEGNGGDREKKEKKQHEFFESDGSVKVKNEHGSFDIKI